MSEVVAVGFMAPVVTFTEAERTVAIRAALALLDRARSTEGVREADYEQAGYDVLVHGRGGPLLLEKRGGGRLTFRALFHPDRSTLPYRVAFPILLANLVNIGFREGKLAEARAARTGVLERVDVAPSTACRVETPGGGSHGNIRSC